MDAPPVQYVQTSDGRSIAYTVTGEGRPFLLTPSGMSHAQLVWELPNTRPWFVGLSRRFRLVNFDGRGQGMSDRGLDDEFSPEDRVKDLDAVVEKLELQDFILMGIGHTAHTAIQYAYRHQHLLRALILLNTAASVSSSTQPFQIELARQNWNLFSKLTGSRWSL